MDLAWTEVCPDSEIEGLTVGDPVAPKNAEVEIELNENPFKLDVSCFKLN